MSAGRWIGTQGCDRPSFCSIILSQLRNLIAFCLSSAEMVRADSCSSILSAISLSS